MKTITIQLNYNEVKALNGVGIDPQKYIDEAVRARVDLAMEDIVNIFVERATRENVQIPVGKEGIVKEAFEREWV